jgi:arsenical pump membrane protein
VLIRPPRLPDWAAALGGGLLMVAFGLLPPVEALQALAANWNVFLFFFGLGLASTTADHAGVFRLAAQAAMRRARGSQRTLIVALFCVGVVVTAVLSNDATALLLTPVVFAIATRAGVDPRPYAFACALVANAASFLLPVSNPSNLLVLARAPLSLDVFLRELLLPQALALAVTLVGLLVVFRQELATPFAPPLASAPASPRAIRAGLGVLGLATAYVVASGLNWPLGVVATLGGVALLALDAPHANGESREIVREMPWAIFPIFGGLLLLVGGGERVGLFAPLQGLVAFASQQDAAGPPLLALALAVLANLINNLPAALVSASALAGVADGSTRDHLAAATIVGVNLGPNLTTVGSLATMLWLLLLRRRGVEVSPLGYLRVGATITVPALLAAAAGLGVALR